MSDALNKLKAQSNAAKDSEESSANDTTEWQVFNCSRKATKVVLPNGKKAIFTEGRCLTRDEEVIDFLSELAETNSSITRGDSITNEEAIDPNIRLRLQIREEERKKLQEQLNYQADMGTSTSQAGGTGKAVTSTGAAS